MTIATKLRMSSVDATNAGIAYRGMNPDALAAAGVPAATIVAATKTWLKAEVDAAAERLRIEVLTPGSGQAMEYQQALAEAQAAIAAPGDATSAKYPMLAASVGLDIDPASNKPAADVLGVARAVVAGANAWAALGAAIRGARLQGKAAIDAAADVAGAVAAFDAIVWPAVTS